MQSKEIDTSTTEVQTAVGQECEGRMAFNESVAHQIIGQFIDEIGKEEAYAAIAKRLEAVVFTGKPTEVDLRTAIFGEIDL